MATIDIRTLSDDLARASFLADHVSDPEGALRVLSESIDDLLAATGDDRLPENLCGPVMGTVGACMVGALMAGFDGPEGTWGGDPIELLMKSQVTAQTVEHAAYDHGDSLARAIRGEEGADPTLSESYDAIVSWVTERLWSSFDADPSLVTVLAGFDDNDDDDADPHAA